VIDETMAILEEVDKRVAAENLAGAIRQLLRANRNLLRVISEMGEDRGST